MQKKHFKQKINEINIDKIEEVAQGIKEGKIAIFPTETVYGIGANALDNKACKKIFKAKERPENKPLIVLISDYNMLNDIGVKINELERKIMNTFWPGPLTIVLNIDENCRISDIVTSGKTNIGIRMTSGKIARCLIQKAEVPIVAPSANISGKATGTKIDDIIKDLGDKVDYIIDCGDIESNLTSTIIKIENEKILILREGKITKEELRQIAEIKEIE